MRLSSELGLLIGCLLLHYLSKAEMVFSCQVLRVRALAAHAACYGTSHGICNAPMATVTVETLAFITAISVLSGPLPHF
jgi:hypothetical protein